MVASACSIKKRGKGSHLVRAGGRVRRFELLGARECGTGGGEWLWDPVVLGGGHLKNVKGRGGCKAILRGRKSGRRSRGIFMRTCFSISTSPTEKEGEKEGSASLCIRVYKG